MFYRSSDTVSKKDNSGVQKPDATSIDKNEKSKVGNEGVCTFCEKKLNSKESLLHHYGLSHRSLIINESKALKCRNCDDLLSTVGLKDHMVNVHKLKGAFCGICNKHFSKVSENVDHVKTSHIMVIKTLSCTICKLSSDNQENLISHYYDKHLQKTTPKETPKKKKVGPETQITSGRLDQGLCGLCKETFESKKSLLQHYSIAHHSIIKESKTLKCNKCNHFITTTLRQHIGNAHRLQGNFCSICHKRFTAVSQIIDHVRSAHITAITKQLCSVCGLDGDQESLILHYLDKHSTTTTTGELVKVSQTTVKDELCHLCETKSGSKSLLEHYLDLHGAYITEIKVWKCGKCQIFFNTQEDKQKHLDEKHTITGNYCPICYKDVSSRSQVVDHLESSHITAFSKLLCIICKMECNSQEELMLHYQEKHCNTGSNDTGIEISKVWRCRVCVTFSDTENDMEKHLQMKHKVQGSFCPVCFKGFMTRSEVIVHLKTSHIEVIETPSCSICSSEFVNLDHLLRHFKDTHASGSTTEVASGSNSSVKSDIMTWRCRKCIIFADTEEDMQKHLDEKHKIEENLCPICYKSLKTQLEVTNHLKSTHVEVLEKPTCHVCKLEFTNLNHLRLHYDDKHKNKPTNERTEKAKSREDETNSQISCVICEAKFETKIEMGMHCRCYHPELFGVVKIWKCMQCDSGYVHSEEGMRKHLEARHEVRQGKCSCCSVSCATYPEALDHWMSHVQVTMKPTCSSCNTPCANDMRVVYHYYEKHILQNEIKEKPAKGSKVDAMQKEASANKRFECHACLEKFQQDLDLALHLGAAHGVEIVDPDLQKQKVFGCPVCIANFKTMELATKHVNQRHFGTQQPVVEQYICRYCLLDMLSEQTLQNHVTKKHSEETDLGLDWGPPARLIPCQICKKKFGSEEGLLSHSKTKHPLKIQATGPPVPLESTLMTFEIGKSTYYKCPYCSYRNIIQVLIEHIYSLHKDMLHEITDPISFGLADDAPQPSDSQNTGRKRVNEPSDKKIKTGTSSTPKEPHGLMPSARGLTADDTVRPLDSQNTGRKRLGYNEPYNLLPSDKIIKTGTSSTPKEPHGLMPSTRGLMADGTVRSSDRKRLGSNEPYKLSEPSDKKIKTGTSSSGLTANIPSSRGLTADDSVRRRRQGNEEGGSFESSHFRNEKRLDQEKHRTTYGSYESRGGFRNEKTVDQEGSPTYDSYESGYVSEKRREPRNPPVRSSRNETKLDQRSEAMAYNPYESRHRDSGVQESMGQGKEPTSCGSSDSRRQQVTKPTYRKEVEEEIQPSGSRGEEIIGSGEFTDIGGPTNKVSDDDGVLFTRRQTSKDRGRESPYSTTSAGSWPYGSRSRPVGSLDGNQGYIKDDTRSRIYGDTDRKQGYGDVSSRVADDFRGRSFGSQFRSTGRSSNVPRMCSDIKAVEDVEIAVSNQAYVKSNNNDENPTTIENEENNYEGESTECRKSNVKNEVDKLLCETSNVIEESEISVTNIECTDQNEKCKALNKTVFTDNGTEDQKPNEINIDKETSTKNDLKESELINETEKRDELDRRLEVFEVSVSSVKETNQFEQSTTQYEILHKDKKSNLQRSEEARSEKGQVIISNKDETSEQNEKVIEDNRCEADKDKKVDESGKLDMSTVISSNTKTSQLEKAPVTILCEVKEIETSSEKETNALTLNKDERRETNDSTKAISKDSKYDVPILFSTSEDTFSSNDLRFKCGLCSDAFSDDLSLKAHCMIWHENLTFCFLCETEVDTESALLQHYRTEHHEILNESKAWRCKNCEISFPSEVNMLKHLKKKHRDENNFCTICLRHFRKTEKVITHLKSLHVGVVIEVSCSYCRMIFEEVPQLVLHYLDHHREEIRNQCVFKERLGKDVRNDPVKSSAENVGLQEIHLSNRVKERHDDYEDGSFTVHEATSEEYSCRYCQQAISAKNLKNHVLQCRPHRETLRCNHCSDPFFTKEELDLHENTNHSDLLENKLHNSSKVTDSVLCPICKTKFKSEKSMIDHSYIKHPAVKLDDSFGVPLQSLVKVDDNDGTYQCIFCIKWFCSLSAIVYHIIRRHEERKEKMSDCVTLGLFDEDGVSRQMSKINLSTRNTESQSDESNKCNVREADSSEVIVDESRSDCSGRGHLKRKKKVKKKTKVKETSQPACLCPICEKDLQSEKNLKMHAYAKHPAIKLQDGTAVPLESIVKDESHLNHYECPICGYRLDRFMSIIKKHFEKKHKDAISDCVSLGVSQSSGDARCDITDEDGTSSRSDKAEEVDTVGIQQLEDSDGDANHHKGIEDNVCPICRKKCSSEEVLLQHASIKHPAIVLGNDPPASLEAVLRMLCKEEKVCHKCPFTDCIFSSLHLYHLMNHILKTHKDKVYLSDCVSMELFDKRSSSLQGEDSPSQAVCPVAFCPICKTFFKRQKALVEHATMKHPAIKMRNGSPLPLRSVLRVQREGKNYYQCPFCCQGYVKVELITYHILKDHQDRAGQISDCVSLELFDEGYGNLPLNLTDEHDRKLEESASSHTDDGPSFYNSRWTSNSSEISDISSSLLETSVASPDTSKSSFPLQQICPATCCTSCVGTCCRNVLQWKQSETSEVQSAPNAITHHECPLCKRTFKSEESLTEHTRFKHPAIKLENAPPLPLESALKTKYLGSRTYYECPFCIHNSTNISSAASHILTKHKERSYQMSNCVSLKLFHDATEKSAPTILCPICKGNFKSEGALKYHAKIKHPAIRLKANLVVPLEMCLKTQSEDSRIIQCCYCTDWFSGLSAVTIHIIERHDEDYRNEISDCITAGLYDIES
ncbi:unnamed protein product [Acanthoscelides obtectus]|uniref:C2H2-type domain-containing protein n=1 Tax=Acanthoscelides obtectus TaxID=200917 RepID=A0A9P0PQF3_ACAOB|nr:unnamed protein product [Acanthoscelides obtectus]CAK1675652.1 Zinc finger protein 521 [Acanthoscelides obtectus]